MDGKKLKKSSLEQLNTLVQYMEENPEFARGVPIFGSSKRSLEDEWKNLCQMLNTLGPPTRTLLEWKKTWADLKSRTKKKIAGNARSIQETGGGLYRYAPLTDLEEAIDRTLHLSSVVETASDEETYDIKEESLLSPIASPILKVNKITRTKSVRKRSPQNRPKRVYIKVGRDSTVEPSTSSGKKMKSCVNDQISLIRRQLRVSEQSLLVNTESSEVLKRIADAAESQAESMKRYADAAESQSATIRRLEEAIKLLIDKNLK
ncbi:uncharacterized protein LOC142224333 [Haematobia irritans]|uniref:uncharacterized protein LOC142224333 n=1 Tax=Haematobia irritans TaxID=7368 RepID=UPI003F4FFB3B